MNNERMTIYANIEPSVAKKTLTKYLKFVDFFLSNVSFAKYDIVYKIEIRQKAKQIEKD